MNFPRNALILPLLVLGLAGCATIKTEYSGVTGGPGIEYALPSSEFVLELREGDGVVSATLAGPIAVADPNAKFRTSLLSSGIATNDFEIEVNNLGLLTSFSGSSEGQLKEIAIKAARTIAYQSAGEEARPFFSRHFRLENAGTIETAANYALNIQMAFICQQKDANNKDTNRCIRLKNTVGLIPGGFVTLTVEPPAVATDQTRANQAASQQAGSNVLFYRPLTSRRLVLSLATGQSQSKVFAVPDESKINWIAIPGGAFAKQEYDLTFSDGVLSKYHRISRNEVVGAVSLPVDVAKSLIAAPIEALNDRKAGLEAQAQYLTAVQNLYDKSAKSKEACDDLMKVCQDLPIQSIYLSTGSKSDSSGQDSSQPGRPGNAGNGPPGNGPGDGSDN